MKKSILAAAFAATIFPAMAQQPADNKPQTQQPAQTPEEFDKQMAQLQESMNRMQQQMDKIRQTQDPQERQKLLQEHWTTMQSAMTSMHALGGPGMGPGMMGGPGMRGGPGMMGWERMSEYYNKLTPEQLKQRQYMMDQRLRLHQMMMEQMMLRQQYGIGPPQPAPKSK